MVGSRKGNKARVRNFSGEYTALFDWHDAVAIAVKDNRGDGHFAEKRTYVDAIASFHDARGVFR